MADQEEASSPMAQNSISESPELDIPLAQEIQVINCAICQNRHMLYFDKPLDLPSLYCLDCSLDLCRVAETLHSKKIPSSARMVAYLNNYFRSLLSYPETARDNFSAALNWLKSFMKKD